ncbi:hypothetical protein KI387_003423, partial [Taxus chinensis]
VGCEIKATTQIKDYVSQPLFDIFGAQDEVPIIARPVGSYDLISDLNKTFSHISFLDLLKNSPMHRFALLKELGLGHLINVTPPSETQVNHVDFDVYPPGQVDRDTEFVFNISKMPTDTEISCR